MSYTTSHRRRNPLTGDWVLISPQRSDRPWSGETSPAEPTHAPERVPNCPLCPGALRSGGGQNPNYRGPHVFTNDFSALSAQGSATPASAAVGLSEGPTPDFMRDEIASGECRVICFDHRHNRTVADLSLDELENLLKTLQQEYSALSANYRCVTLFENKGALMGCSQPHPHGQIWAHEHLSTTIANEDQHQREYFEKHGAPLLADYQAWESNDGERVVFENAGWLVVVPYWAEWPFETLLITKGNQAHFGQLTADNRATLAEAMAVLTRAYDALFSSSFPYSMGWHNAPEPQQEAHWRLHAHFFPPLLRSAQVKKHRVGYEMLGESQRDLSPESAAEKLRLLADDVQHASMARG